MKLFNSLTRKKEEFVPLVEGQVSMYNCGPTVYNFIHVGNARPLVTFDTLRRYFIYKGYDVRFVLNFTDIDDKLINKAKEENITVEEVADRYIAAFKEDAGALGIYQYNTINPKATDYISQMVDFIKALEEKGAAYEVDGNVYFSIESARDYGKLSKKNIDELVSGARIDVNEDKRNPMDFVLWKKEKPGEPSWDSPWGKGRPGWHIECSVMAKALLGETIDIHSGGEDLQFPHHENEIAQSETLTGKPFANYWLHNGMLFVDNQKMSKSLGNFFTLKEIQEEYEMEVLRFFLLSAHYRKPINFSREIMDQNRNGLERLYGAKKNLEFLLEKDLPENLGNEDSIIAEIDAFKKSFEDSMDDDLNTADAVAAIFDLVKYTNSNFNEESSRGAVRHSYDILMQLAKVLGILTRKDEILDEEIQKLIEDRNEARKNRDFAKADQIRDDLLERGIVLEDTRDGVKWKRV
ncbi:cysteine--tRNA ligase [Gudongella sp. SC589]|uniref:cysteine--tRNA ligase n=1 Tax=Gudongella sp. SC589 TaxID=3385990 RepID=UPI003904653F